MTTGANPMGQVISSCIPSVRFTYRLNILVQEKRDFKVVFGMQSSQMGVLDDLIDWLSSGFSNS